MMIDQAYIHVPGDREETGAHFMRCFNLYCGATPEHLTCVYLDCVKENRATMKAFFILLSCKFTSNLYATYVLSCCLLIACPCACVLGVSVAHNNITIVLVGAVPVVEGTTSPSLGLMEQALHIDTHMHTTHTQTQTQSLAHTHTHESQG